MGTLHVGYLVSKYPDVSHTFILREVLALRARGMEISVASINPPTALTEIERQEAASTFYVKQAGPLGALKALLWMLARPANLLRGLRTTLSLAGSDLRRILLCLFYLAEAMIVARWMHQRNLAHLHVHFATPAATVALLATRIAPVTMSMTVHGPDEFFDVTHYSLAQKVAASRFVVCISFFARSQMMKLTPGPDWPKFEIARLGVDPGHFAPRPRPPGDAIFRILCVGRLVPAKGQRILIQAVQALHAEGRQIELVLVGDGPDRSALEHITGPTVRFAGSSGQDRIQVFYRAADCFALASFAEGIPVVLMEAMAMEIPCIATSINGIPELIHDNLDGLLVPPSDVLGLAAALRRLMDDPPLRARLGQAARRKVIDQYSLAASADRLHEIFLRRLA